jgi:branched-chain amino acid aminotransferase/4-amino-4-deoxychorismate lyase
MFLVYNSDILPEKDFSLSINDRAFQYGDGLFETIRYETGQIWFWTDHFTRLSAGMAALGLAQPDGFTTDSLHQRIRHLLEANDLTNYPARIKIQVWRQPGGLYTPSNNQINLLITARPGQAFSITEKASIGIYDRFRLSHSPVSAFKTINALPYVLAGQYKSEHGLDDVILLDMNGNMAECIASNLFWYANQTLYTPSLQTGCINGILRQQLLRLAPAVGLSVAEGLYQPDVLLQADAVFCANVMGIQWLRRITNSQADLNVQLTTSSPLLDVLFAQLHG